MGGKKPKPIPVGGIGGGVVGEESKEIQRKRPKFFWSCLCSITPLLSTFKSRMYLLINREKKD
jgi:hypothetical protein